MIVDGNYYTDIPNIEQSISEHIRNIIEYADEVINQLQRCKEVGFSKNHALDNCRNSFGIYTYSDCTDLIPLILIKERDIQNSVLTGILTAEQGEFFIRQCSLTHVYEEQINKIKQSVEDFYK